MKLFNTLMITLILYLTNITYWESTLVSENYAQTRLLNVIFTFGSGVGKHVTDTIYMTIIQYCYSAMTLNLLHFPSHTSFWSRSHYPPTVKKKSLSFVTVPGIFLGKKAAGT
jgi:hypothetical protein